MELDAAISIGQIHTAETLRSCSTWPGNGLSNSAQRLNGLRHGPQRLDHDVNVTGRCCSGRRDADDASLAEQASAAVKYFVLLMCRYDASPLCGRREKRHNPDRNLPLMASMRRPARKVLTTILALFIFPLAVHAALYASKDHPASFRDADWSSVGMLPAASAGPRRPAAGVYRPHRTLEGHFLRSQLGGVQARERHRLEPLRRRWLGPAGAQQWLGAGRALVRRHPTGIGGRARSQRPLPSFRRSRPPSRPTATAMSATIACGPGQTATRSPPPCCAPCPSSRPRCLPTPWARIFATASISAAPTAAPASKRPCGGFSASKVGWIEGVRAQLPRSGGGARSAPPRGKAAGVRPHRHC